MLHVHHCHLTLGGATGAKSSFKPLEVEDASQKVGSLRQFRARRGVQVGGLWEVQARKSKAKEPPGQISHFTRIAHARPLGFQEQVKRVSQFPESPKTCIRIVELI